MLSISPIDPEMDLFDYLPTEAFLCTPTSIIKSIMGALLSYCLKGAYSDIGFTDKRISRQDNLRSLLSDKDNPHVDGRKSSMPSQRSPDWGSKEMQTGRPSTPKCQRQQTMPCLASSPTLSYSGSEKADQDVESPMPKGFNMDGSLKGKGFLNKGSSKDTSWKPGSLRIKGKD